MEDLKRLAELRDKGLITEQEFEIERSKIVPSNKEKAQNQTAEILDNSIEDKQGNDEIIESEIAGSELEDSALEVLISADGNEIICPPGMSEEDMGVALLTGNYKQELSDDPQKRVPGYGIIEGAVVNQIRKIAMENLESLENFPPNLRRLCGIMKKLPAGESRRVIVGATASVDLRGYAKQALKSLTIPDVSYTQYGVDFLFAIAFIQQIFSRQDDFLEELEGGTHALLDNATVLASALVPELGELEFQGKRYSSRELLYRVFWDIHLTMDPDDAEHRMMRWAVIDASIDHPRKWKKEKLTMFQVPLVAGGIKAIWIPPLAGIASLIRSEETGTW